MIGSLELITDGNKAGADGAYVELKPGVQNVVIDLEARCTIFAILIWHFHKEARAYAGVVVQVADDPDFIEIQTIAFEPDSALLLCSDGLSDLVPSREIQAAMERNAPVFASRQDLAGRSQMEEIRTAIAEAS